MNLDIICLDTKGSCINLTVPVKRYRQHKYIEKKTNCIQNLKKKLLLHT